MASTAEHSAPVATEPEGAHAAAAAAAAAPAGKPAEALKWRIDVEDYVSEDNASVVDDLIEELHEQNNNSNAVEEHAEKAAPAQAQAPAPAPSAAPSPAPAPATAPLGSSSSSPPSELSQLYERLKETRERAVTSPEEQAQKAEEIAMLQSALKQQRGRTTSTTSTSSSSAAGAAGSGYRAQAHDMLMSKAPSSGFGASSGFGPSASSGFRAPPSGLPQGMMDGTTAMRRVASEGPPEGLMSSQGMYGMPYGMSSSHEGYGGAEAGGMGIQRTQTSMTANGRSRNGGESYRAPPTARSTAAPRDPRFDPRQTVGFSEAQARAMGLIQGGAPSAGQEARAEDVAHMQWKAGGMSRAPSVAGRSYAGSVANGYGGDDSASVASDAPWEGVKRGGKSTAGSVYGDASNAIVPANAPMAPVTVSPWRNAGLQVYKDQEIETVDPIVDNSDAYSTISGAYFRAPPEKSGAPSEFGDHMTVALSFRHSDSVAPKMANKMLSRRLGQLTMLGDEGVTMPEMSEPVDDVKSVKSVAMTERSAQVLPPAPQPVGTLDLQMFNKLVKEMREEGQNIQKLKQQNNLLQGWYSDSKSWADEKSLRAWEAMSIADDAEDVAAMKHKMLKELDNKLGTLKEKMAGYSMLEQENRMLRHRIQGMTNVKSPDSVLANFKSGARTDIISGLLAGSQKTSQADLDMLNQWIAEMQEDGGQVQRLKKLNRLLQGWYADANSRAEDAIARERDEFRRAKEAEELAAAGDLLLMEMEAKHSEMRMKLAARQMLEQENRELRSKIIALSSAKGPNMPVQKQQDILLAHCKENMGYSLGRPVMACIVYKAMVHWSMIEVERLNTFDAVLQLQEEACKQANPDVHSYWLSNSVHMLFLATRGPTRIDSAMAKTQLASKTERLYVTIRDNVKGQLTSILNNLLQPPPVPMDDNMTEVGSVVSGANTTVLHKLVPSAGNVRRQCTMMWENVIGALRQLVDVLRANFVPPLIVRELLAQLLQFVDFKLFNNMMMHSPWVPCTLTNGETLEAGMADLEDWLVNVDEWLNSSLMDTISLTSSTLENIKHVKQATVLLLDNQKSKRSLRSIQKLCPDLSMTQLAHICTWFEDDKDGMPGVEPAVIEQMWALMHEDQPFLLKEEKSCPFSGEEVARSMREFTMDDIEPPSELKREPSFHFLIPSGLSGPELNPEPVPGMNESNVPITPHARRR